MKTPVEEFASVLQRLTEKVRELELRRCRPGRARPMVAVRVVSHSSRRDASSSVRRGLPKSSQWRPAARGRTRKLANVRFSQFARELKHLSCGLRSQYLVLST
jgi:hypothetical protein